MPRVIQASLGSDPVFGFFYGFYYHDGQVLSILIEDTLTAIATGHDMVYCTSVLNAKRSKHAFSLPRSITLVNRKQGLTPAKLSPQRSFLGSDSRTSKLSGDMTEVLGWIDTAFDTFSFKHLKREKEQAMKFVGTGVPMDHPRSKVAGLKRD